MSRSFLNSGTLIVIFPLIRYSWHCERILTLPDFSADILQEKKGGKSGKTFFLSLFLLLEHSSRGNEGIFHTYLWEKTVPGIRNRLPSYRPVKNVPFHRWEHFSHTELCIQSHMGGGINVPVSTWEISLFWKVNFQWEASFGSLLAKVYWPFSKPFSYYNPESRV